MGQSKKGEENVEDWRGTKGGKGVPPWIKNIVTKHIPFAVSPVGYLIRT